MSVSLGAYFERTNHYNLYSTFKVLDSTQYVKITEFKTWWHQAVFIKQYSKT